MKHNASDPPDDIRRHVLARLLAGGFAAVVHGPVLAMASTPKKQGILELLGQVLVNGLQAALGEVVVPGDTIETGPGSRVVYVVGRSVFLQRESSRVVLEPPAKDDDSIVVDAFRVITGAILSVHPRGERSVSTPTAAIGIRGTGLYVDAQKDRTYVCVCYGRAELATADGAQMETVRTQYHESPRYIYPQGQSRRIVKAPVIDHTDDELILLESLVRRKPPFLTPEFGYGY